MPTKTLDRAKIITPQILETLHHPVPQSWLDVAGILKGKKKVNALKYQKQVRKDWDKRLNKLNTGKNNAF